MMTDGQPEWIEAQAALSLKRLLPRIEPLLENVTARDIFIGRLKQYFPAIFRLLYTVYGSRYDFFYHLEQSLIVAARMFASRPAALHELDHQREVNPT
ncbi:MAG: amylosucrase, partial [Anaerolineae bacterium]|nr:amylosucrase [Anaerolineae bacterium]